MLGPSKINQLIALLISLGLLPKLGPQSWSVRISTCYSFLFYQSRADFIQVKLGMGLSLLNEYLSLERAYSVFPDLVPFPYGLYKQENDHLIVSRGVCHQPMSRGRHDISPQEYEALYIFFSHYNHYFQLITPINALSALADKTLSSDLHGIASELSSYPQVSQHGDLALTNLGKTSTGLVIFDWEDFGTVVLPYYDLTIFLCSFYDFKVEVIFEILRSKSRMGCLVSNLLKEEGIGLKTYLRWIPLHLALFSKMKSKLGYSSEAVELSSKASGQALGYLKAWEKACVT